MHRDEVWTEQDFDMFIQDHRYRDRYESWNQGLWWVLIGKTIGDVLLRVRGVVTGKWYGRIQTTSPRVRETQIWASLNFDSGY